MRYTVNGEPPRTKKFLVIDEASLDWADDTFTRREAAIEKTAEALVQIKQIEETLRKAAVFLDQNDPMLHKILSYPMRWDDMADSLRDDIAEWKRDQDELANEIWRYNASHFETLDSGPDQ